MAARAGQLAVTPLQTPRRQARAILLRAALLVAAAAAGRFALFDLVEFKYDEAQVSADALALVRDHVLPETSILTSGGWHNSPLFVYLVALPMLLSTAPLLVTAFIAALNALAAGGLYLTIRRPFGEAVGLSAGLLFAVNPLAVHYARKIWAPDLMPPFTVLWFAGLLLALGEGWVWGLPLSFLALAVLVQLHQAALTLVPVTAFLVLAFGGRLGPRRLGTWAALLLGFAGSAVLFLPYAAYELDHHLADLRGIAGQVSSHAGWSGAAWLDLWWLTAAWRPTIFFDPLAAQEHLTLGGASLLDWLVLLLALLGLLACLRWLLQQARDRLGGLHSAKGYQGVAVTTLLLGSLIPPLVLMRSAVPMLPHYLVFLVPLLATLVALGADVLGGWLSLLASPPTLGKRDGDGKPGATTNSPPGLLRGVLGSILIGVLAGSALVRQVSFDRALQGHVAGGDYGTPLRYSVQAAAALSAFKRAFLVGTDGDFRSVFAYFARVGIGSEAAMVDPAQAFVLPATGDAAYLTDGSGALASAAALPTAAVTDAGEVRRLPDAGAPAYTLLRMTPQQAQAAAARLRAELAPVGPFQVGSGITLVAAQERALGAGGPLLVTLSWQIENPAPFRRKPVQLFIHLYDARRETVAQADGLGYPAAEWQAGDRLFTWFRLTPKAPLAPGQYTLVAGLYVVEGFVVYPVRGPRGEDLGGEIPLGTVAVG